MPATFLVRCCVLTLACAFGAPRAVHAHAIVVATVPAANSTVDGAHVAIDLEFNSRIDAGRSRLSIIDGAQQARSLTIEPATSPNRIRSVARNLAAGDQLLEWYVLSADGHITRGRLKFKVRTAP